MGEFAELANVTKRTIDYYTRIGLLKAERSSSNYRYYSMEAISRLRYIEELKKKHLSLNEIKAEIKQQETESLDLDELKDRIKDLEQDVSAIASLLKEKGIQNPDMIKKHLSHETMTLIQSLLMLLV
ncbi:MerR family transcriptional regulator [Bacillus sp. CECT 9360]|uniref:MerR family transcriptional regulator n=1 Tax=Bacillus sp. CECT 9360 TaxID=2845821 RepID=UPI0025B6DF76|nr:MerR family transcriptional regulator [Bacillus sp. CECT 9360]